MSDVIDDANERADLFLNVAKGQRRREGPAPNGRCHYCSESVAKGNRFCDTECRDEWEREQQIRTGQFAGGRVRPVEDDEGDDE